MTVILSLPGSFPCLITTFGQADRKPPDPIYRYFAQLICVLQMFVIYFTPPTSCRGSCCGVGRGGLCQFASAAWCRAEEQVRHRVGHTRWVAQHTSLNGIQHRGRDQTAAAAKHCTDSSVGLDRERETLYCIILLSVYVYFFYSRVAAQNIFLSDIFWLHFKWCELKLIFEGNMLDLENKSVPSVACTSIHFKLNISLTIMK